MLSGSSSSTFQLTTSRRGRQVDFTTHCKSWNFNSRPHEEVDDYYQLMFERRCDISTHDLTKRSTNLQAPSAPRVGHFNSRPHEEVDLSRRPMRLRMAISTHDLTKRSTQGSVATESRFTHISTHDLTKRSTDRIPSGSCTGCISTHDLTKRSTAWNPADRHMEKEFQLTTSRRGRLSVILIINTNIGISTHDLTKRSTH